MKTFLLCFLCAGLIAAQAANEEKPAPKKGATPAPLTAPPEEIAHTYIRAMADARMSVVADVMHPGALERFKTILSGLADAIINAPADRRPPQRVIDALFGSQGPAALKQQTPRDVFVGFMSNLTTFLPQVREMTAGSEYQVLGHVDEGNLTHVVFRATLRRGDAGLSKMSVLSLKRDGEDWKVLLTDDLSDIIGTLGRGMLAPPSSAAAPQAPAGQ